MILQLVILAVIAVNVALVGLGVMRTRQPREHEAAASDRWLP